MHMLPKVSRKDLHSVACTALQSDCVRSVLCRGAPERVCQCCLGPGAQTLNCISPVRHSRRRRATRTRAGRVKHWYACKVERARAFDRAGVQDPFARWRCCVCTVLTCRHRSARLHVCAMRRDVRLEQRMSSIRARCGNEGAFFEHASVRAPSRCTLARLQHPHHERRVHHNRKLARTRCENATGDTADWLHRLGMMSQPNTCRQSQSRRRWATHAAPAVQKFRMAYGISLTSYCAALCTVQSLEHRDMLSGTCRDIMALGRSRQHGNVHTGGLHRLATQLGMPGRRIVLQLIWYPPFPLPSPLRAVTQFLWSAA